MIGALRIKLTIAYTVILGLVLVVFATATYWFVRQALYDGVEGGARIVERDIAPFVTLRAGKVAIDGPRFADAFEDSSHFQGVAAVQVVSLEGAVIAKEGADIRLPPIGLGEDQTVRVTGQPVWIHSRAVEVAGRPVATIRIVRSLSDLERTLQRFRIGLFGFIPVALLVASGLGIAMAGEVIKPIRDAFESLRRFTADASHELRTPLAVIQAQLDLLAHSDGADGTMVQELARPIAVATGRMARLVGDLLFLARSDGAASVLDRMPLDFDELVEEACDEFRPAAEAKGLRLTYSGHPAPLVGDPVRLHQVVANLLDNAIKYTDHGDVRVELAPQQGHSGAVLKVADTGEGIEAAEVGRVFDRFYRADSARASERQGSGLGLAIVKAIVQAHHGEIQLSSQIGRGTTATVTLPASS